MVLEFLIVYGLCGVSARIPVQYMHTHQLQSPGDVCFRTGVTDNWKPPYIGWILGIGSGSLEKQPVILTIDPNFQSIFLFSGCYFFGSYWQCGPIDPKYYRLLILLSYTLEISWIVAYYGKKIHNSIREHGKIMLITEESFRPGGQHSYY